MLPPWWRLTFLVAWWAPLSEAMCPQGFGQANYFPPEWKIPEWPQDMSIEEAALLRTIKLGGFKMTSLNEEYLEGPSKAFEMQGRETYWQASGKYFMYYCQRFQKWRIAEIAGFANNMEGNCFAFVSDAYPQRDIRNSSLLKGFIEVEDGQWRFRENAGVAEVGTLGDQMDLEQETEEEAASEECANDTDTDDESEDSPFGKKKKDSNCPVMPVVRKGRDKVVQAAKAAGKWVRRLFPKYLGSPDEQDAIPEDSLLDPNSENCNTDTKDGCSFKQKFYIEKMSNQTAEQQAAELQRLWGMKGVVMKQEQKEWLMTRVSLLQKMSKSAENVESAEKAEL